MAQKVAMNFTKFCEYIFTDSVWLLGSKLYSVSYKVKMYSMFRYNFKNYLENTSPPLFVEIQQICWIWKIKILRKGIFLRNL